MNINRITVDFHSPPPPLHTTLAFALVLFDHACQIADESLPSIEGCGLDFHCLGSLRSEDAAPVAPPLSKGMWAA